MAEYDMEFDKKDEETPDEKKKRSAPLQTYYEALEAVLSAGSILDNPNFGGAINPPIVLISRDEKGFDVGYYTSSTRVPNDPELAGHGETVDEAFADLIESMQASVEESRRKAMAGIDELLKKSASIVKKVKAKKRDGVG